ncbi:SCY1-like protein 2 [Salvelinus alpinus]
MESMLNKLKSTVTKVTADMTSAVMGNPVTREFEVGRHIASGGPGMCWRIYNGTKKSTKQEVAVFVFDKKMVDKYQKFDKDQIIESLKRGVQQLTRLRHPRLLTVQHPLEESRWVKLTVCFPVQTVCAYILTTFCDIFVCFGVLHDFLGLIEHTIFFLRLLLV